jgi:protoporphyrinogen/coproporphyrinogen III oxidase
MSTGWSILSMNTRQLNARTGLSKHVVIVGGGITGLSAAWYLQQSQTNYSLLEQSNRWGGKILTEQVGEFILEAGPDAFLTRKPWALELARELGLSERIQPVNTENSRTFVLHRGKPAPLPDGLQLLVPSQWKPFLRSPLFSVWGKLRALLEPFVPSQQSDVDETLASFVRRRLGAEMLDKLGEPLLAGVYNGDPERQSILATFPQFPALEKKHGSLIRGMRAAPREAHDTPAFISFKTGAHELVQALVEQLDGDLQLNTGVSQIEQLENGHYLVHTNTGSVIEADAIILATPAYISAQLLQGVAPAAAEHLKAISYSGIGTAYFAFYREDVPHPLNGFGLVVPRSENRSIDGVTWTSSKWNGRAPSDTVLLRVFFGGMRTQGMLRLDDTELLKTLRGELELIFGISTAATALFHRVYRWQDGYPQYHVGHLEHLAAAEAALPDGMFIAGSAYRGVGVPDCVRQGRDAAKKASALLVGV